MDHNADQDELVPVEDDAQDFVESQMPPPPAPSTVELQWVAFNKGVDAMQKLYGGIANQGHRKQWAAKAGIPVPGE